MNEAKTILKGLGLSGKEIDILLALYSLKQATVAGLARKSGIPRTTIYTALSKLIERQMVLRAKVGKRELWEAISPQRLIAIKQEQVAQLKSVAPALEQLATPSSFSGPSIIQYHGTEGLERVYDMMLELDKGERILGFEGGRSSEKKTTLLSEDYSRNWHSTLKKRGIILEVAVSEKLLEIIRSASISMLHATHGRASITYTLPDELMNSDSDIIVFRHHVAIITPKDRHAILITDSAVSTAFRQFMNIAFLSGKKIDLNAHIAAMIDTPNKNLR